MTILEEITAERKRQDRLWGEQNHPPPLWCAILLEEVGEVAAELLEQNFGRARTELIQVAAVAVAMVESLDRNQLGNEGT